MVKTPTDDRDTSRKWRLVVGGILLYTAVHFVNAGGILLATAFDWIESAGAIALWTHSITVWSAGVVFFAGLYQAANVAQKWAPDPDKP